jgi:hypothetical protein
MFAKTTNVGFAQRVVTTLVASAVLMASYGFYNTAQAANLVEVSNLLSTSAPGVNSSHTFDFNIPTGSALGATNTVSIIFPAGFIIDAGIAASDLTVTEDFGGTPNVVTPTGVTLTGQTISFGGVVAAAGITVRVVVADTEVTNPAKVLAAGVGDSYEFTITTDAAGTPIDSGKTRVVIIDTVLVSAIVNTTFDFTITGLATTTSVHGTTTTGTTGATSIPFGVLTADTRYILAQQLNVTTNARNGFVVTVETDGDLQSSTGAIIDTFIDGANTATPTAWQSPADNIALDTTWGHWGLASDDDLTVPYATGQYSAALPTPQPVFTHGGPSDGVLANVGQANVLYQLEITPLQEAGDDYNTTLTYIATPTF